MSFPSSEGLGASGDDGICVRRATTVSVENGQLVADNRRASQVTTTIGFGDQGSQTQGDSQLIAPSEFFPSVEDVSTGSHLSTRKNVSARTSWNVGEGNWARELIEFLRNTPPPPGNYMSIPDSFSLRSGRKKSRWSFWPFRKKSSKRLDKEAKTAPGLIKLPDSAVAGRTIDGHRHIAISIPIEHAHLEPLPRKSATPSPERQSESAVMVEQVENPPASPGSSAQSEISETSRSRDGFVSICWQLDDSSTRKSGAEPVEPSVGDHSMISSPSPELKTLPEGSARPADVLTSGVPDQIPLPYSQSWTQYPMDSHNTGEASPCQSMKSGQEGGSSADAESFYTGTSEPIFSDAVTVRIPSPQLLGDFSLCQGPMDINSEAASFHSSGSHQSSVRTSSRKSGDATESCDYYQTQDAFSTPDDRITPEIPETTDESAPSCTTCRLSLYQPALVRSLEPPPLQRRDLRVSRLTPVMTVADVQPSTPRRRSFEHAGHTTTENPYTDDGPPPPIPRRADGRTRRSTSVPESREMTASPDNLSEAANTAYTTDPSHQKVNDRDTNDFHTPSPRPMSRLESNTSLTQQYEDTSRVRNHELQALANRLEQLEATTNRYLSVVVPAIERMSSQLFSGPSSRSLSLSGYPSRSSTVSDWRDGPITQDRSRSRRGWNEDDNGDNRLLSESESGNGRLAGLGDEVLLGPEWRAMRARRDAGGVLSEEEDPEGLRGVEMVMRELLESVRAGGGDWRRSRYEDL